nr:aldo/keto reductase [Candidatus Mycoplasma haemohominis]
MDCAWRYGNEPYIGMALRQLRQKDKSFDLSLPFQSKVWPTKFNGGINKSLKFALQKIGAFSCIDTYFLHYPSDSWAANLLAYKQLIECMNKGQTKKVGLGNFDLDLLERLFKFTQKHPHTLQHNLSINNLNLEVLSYCRKNNIELQAYEPLGEFKSNSKNPVLKELSQKYECSVKNLLIAYLLELGIVPVVPVNSPEEINEIVNAKKIQISSEDMEILKSFNKYKSKRRKS